MTTVAPLHLDRSRLRAHLTLVLMAIVTASVLALGVAALMVFDRAVSPELDNRTRLIGSIVRGEIQRTVELGIPFDALVGLEDYIAETLADFEEVDRISVDNAAGRTITEIVRDTPASFLQNSGLGRAIGLERGVFVLPILAGNEIVGEITVETSAVFVETRLREILLDVMVIGLVASVFALELALAVAVGSVGKPLDRVFRLLGEQREGDFRHCARAGGLSGLGRAVVRLNDHAVDLAERFAGLSAAARVRIEAAGARIADGRPLRVRVSDFNDIRLALFLFSVATEIAAAFLPLYARQAARPAWLAPELAAAAPLLLYLVALAALSPFGCALARRFGPRRLFLASVPLTALSLAAMAFSDTLLAVAVWRATTALFYATATISCQEYALRAAGPGSTARPAAAFVAVIYGGVFCGAGFGGVVASRFGFEAAFLTGALIALASGALGARAMSGRAGDAGDVPAGPAQGSRSSGSLRWLLSLLFGIAVPMNAATAIFIWYLTPLMLAAAGSGPAEIARVVMLYYLAQIVLGPLVARAAEARAGPATLVIAGAAVSGVMLLSLLLWGGFWAIALAVAGLGLGHALIRAPQYALTLARTGGSSASLSALRAIERLGALAGLAASAVWLRELGPETTVRTLGIVVLLAGTGFAIVHFRHARVS